MTERVMLQGTKLLLAGWMAAALPLFAQSAAPAAIPPAYDVVSVRPNKSGPGMMSASDHGVGYTATNVPLLMLIRFAYNLKTDAQLIGLPGWADSARFDIQAKLDEDGTAALKKLPRQQAIQQRRLLMQALLADRFQLKVHHLTRELPMYVLVIANGGTKLKDADPNDTYPNGIKSPDGTSRPGMTQTRNGQMIAQAIPISGLVDNLSLNVDRIIVDKTGLSGKYDMTLRWSSDEVASAQQDPTANSAPSLFTALQEQLGLRLESTKGPVDTIVVDHVAMPSEN